MSEMRTRRCAVCDQTFEAPRTTGRPATRCSEACQRVARSRHQSAYIRRLIDARDQLTRLQAA